VQRMVLGMLSDWLSNLSESRKRVFLFPGIATRPHHGWFTKNIRIPAVTLTDRSSTFWQ
jgi:hypothetical protein